MTAGQHDDVWPAVDWSAYVGDVEVRNRRVRYLDVGSGPVILLVHGQGGSWQWWLRILPMLVPTFRVVALDLAGFGSSEPVTEGDVFDEHVATILGLMDSLDIATAVVVGHSMGGLVAMELAGAHPERLTGLVLIDSGGGNFDPRRLRVILHAFRMFEAVFRRPRVPRAVARRALLRKAFFAAAVAQPRCISELIAEQILPQMASPGFLASMEAAGAAVNRVDAGIVACPTLLIWGKQDWIVPLETGRQLLAAIPNARLLVLEDVGHCPMLEQPLETATAITDFAAQYV